MTDVETFMRALADPTRLRILNLLLSAGELCVCELTGALELAQPKVSRHLGILRQAGVVRDRRQGLWIHYRIDPELPLWAGRLLEALSDGCRERDPYRKDLERLPTTTRNQRDACGG